MDGWCFMLLFSILFGICNVRNCWLLISLSFGVVNFCSRWYCPSTIVCCFAKMPFTTPSYIPKLPFDPPDSVPIHEFLFSDGDEYGRYPIADSLPPFTCGITGKSHSAVDVKNRIEWLSAALASELGFDVNTGSEFDKVIGLFSFNTVWTWTLDGSLIDWRLCASNRSILCSSHGQHIASQGFHRQSAPHIRQLSSRDSSKRSNAKRFSLVLHCFPQPSKRLLQRVFQRRMYTYWKSPKKRWKAPTCPQILNRLTNLLLREKNWLSFHSWNGHMAKVPVRRPSYVLRVELLGCR